MEIVTIWLLFAFTTTIIANSRGRSGLGWFFIGLILGVFGLILVLALPKVKTT